MSVVYSRPPAPDAALPPAAAKPQVGASPAEPLADSVPAPDGLLDWLASFSPASASFPDVMARLNELQALVTEIRYARSLSF